ncbi:alpha/beta fold hydrolase, partial [Myxococcota bacterium]|nr:alpha/beta fold hydrolase [Myxococcota bacterium]
MTTPTFVRTPDAAFRDLPGFSFAPHYLDWQGLRVHHLDEGPRDAPVMLLLHGEPTWSHLYRDVIPRLVAAGYRCVAPDLVGFGRSDKVTDDAWYVVERHCERLRFLIEGLDLRRIHLVCQDWGGPTGLRQAVDLPDRFARLFVANTWLHHDGFDYSPAIRGWRAAALDPAKLGGDMPVGRIVAGSLRRPGHDRAAIARAFDAPFAGPESKAGARRFPFCIPFAEPEAGNAADQRRCFEALKRYPHPIHFVFGDADEIFPWTWAERWHALVPGSTLDRIPGAGHFVQADAATELSDAILRHAGDA